MEVGTIIRCINAEPFPGNKVGPPLELGKQYPIKGVYEEIAKEGPKGNCIFHHYDVGLVSEYNFITSQDTGVELPGGETIHWCHPSRFEIV